MNDYIQSQTIAEIAKRHPFPWREQRMMNLVRLVDANEVEVVLFEITALAVLVTHQLAQRPNQTEEAK